MRRFYDLTFTPAVKAVQERLGSRRTYARVESRHGGGAAAEPDALGADERAFLAARDSCYLATVGAGGWPYLQHRGGPPGFVRALDAHTLGFADFQGNRQYISVGNVSGDDRVALIFVDYPNRTRLKILARARIVTAADAPDLIARLAVAGYAAKVERAFVLTIEGLDWNCPQHITPRFTEAEVRAGLGELHDRLAALERDNHELRAQLAAERERRG